jgi:hypothetical protein
MAANTSINLVDLDFDSLKASLKAYLKNQTLFQDYDFDGSNMSVLLDILSYNSYLNTFYLNMVASEMFLDSAQLKNSVISLAKSLNYTPRSTKSARALLNLSFAQSGLSSFEIPEGTRFTGRNSNGSFTFVTGETLTLYPANNKFTAANVEVYEGSFIQDSFVYDSSIEAQRFILSNDTVDTDSILISVNEDNGQTSLTYKKATSLYGLTANSQVYFVQATEDTKYEVVFGDGTFGRKPKDGATIIASYRISSGNSGNECTTFILDDNLGSYNGYTSAIVPSITVSANSYGGAESESIEEIRFRAPRNFQTQERAVTIEDFKSLVLQNYQDIKSAHVYGGETITGQPQFGKVFIAPATFTGEMLSDAEKRDIESYLTDKCTLGVTPVVVDPDFLYILVDVLVKYNPAQTVLSPSDISTIVKNTITTFNTTELNDFDADFRFSRFEAAINDANPSISSNETKVSLKKIVLPSTNTPVFIAVQFRNKIAPGSFYSSEFLSNGRRYSFTDYNPNANTFTVTQSGTGVQVVNSSNIIYLKDVTTPGIQTYQTAGTIDYTTGTITLNQITISDTIDIDGISFYCKSEEVDVTSSKNDVLLIDLSEGITITVKPI